MEKKKVAKTMMITAALASGIALTQSFFNEIQATGNDKKPQITTCGGNSAGGPWHFTCVTGTTTCTPTDCPPG